MASSPSLDQFLGCLLGQAVGDAVAAPFEGLLDDVIFHSFGGATEILKNPTNEKLYYTDDTQMMIGVAETLVEHGCIVEETLCRAFADNYDPRRGYGQGARKVIEAMAEGGDWRGLATAIFPGGSLGNGAAMRVAPVGMLFCDDLDMVREQARLSALPTHVHPVGIEGAQLLAQAVALAAREPVFNRKAFYRELLARATTEEFRWALSAAARLSPRHTVSFLGNSLEANRSVVTSIACFALAPDSYEDAIGRALGLGNDTDTLAAMTGAISGARLGVGAVPRHLIDRLENKGKGRKHIQELATGLFDRYRELLQSGSGDER